MRNFFGFHLDNVGFWASVICAVHCAFLPLVVMLFSWNALKVNETGLVDLILISITLLVAVLSIWSGYTKHNQFKAIYFLAAGILLILISRHITLNVLQTCLMTMGATSLATAHYFNWKLSVTHQEQQKSKT